MKMNSKLKVLIKLIDDLNWDYDRMSSSGQKTMDQINQIIRPQNPKIKSWLENLKEIKEDPNDRYDEYIGARNE